MRAALLLSILALGACEPSPGAGPDAAAAPPAPSQPVAIAKTPVDAGAAPHASRRVVLHAARALSPRTGTVVAPAWIEIDNGAIASIGATPPALAEGARELGDATVLPGLIDAHTHLLTSTAPDEGESMVAEIATMSDGDRALRGAKFAREMLAAGFTTVRDLGNSGRSADVSLKRAIERGWIFGPSMVVSTRALAPPGGQFAPLAAGGDAMIDHEYAIVRSADEARAHVRQAFYEGADVVKLIVDSGRGRTMTLEEVKAAVEWAHGAGRKVAAHVLTKKSAALAVAAGVDSCEHGYDIDEETLVAMAKRNIALVATDYPLDYYEKMAPSGAGHDEFVTAVKRQRATSIDRLARAKKNKVPIVFGSDAYVRTELGHRGREAALVFRAYAEAGLTPIEIVRAATSSAADLLALPPKTTSMERGSPADLVVVTGDPTRDVESLYKVVLVVKNGRVVDPTEP